MATTPLTWCRNGISVRASKATDFYNKLCHQPTHAAQRIDGLFNYLVGASEQRGRYGKTEGLCDLEID